MQHAKSAKTVGILCKARPFIGKDLLLSLFYSLIYPHLIYGNIVWDNNYIDCKTVRIFAYSSTRGQSNKRSVTRLKTESETGERR